jgi:hypothetical protein
MQKRFLNNFLLGSMAVLGIWSVTRAQTAKQPAAVAAKTIADAAPNLSGVWTPVRDVRPPGYDQHGIRQTIPPDKDQADFFTMRHSPYPLQPWAQEKFDYMRDPDNPYYQGRNELNPFLNGCAPEGPTVKWQDMNPFEIIQSPKRVLIIFEMNHEIRQIWTDGRRHPKDFGHNWMGHSIGHWEGGTLVVDTIGLNDLTWLDKAGHVHSDQLHLIERLQRVEPDKMVVTITFDDPKTFTMPWTAHKTYRFEPDWEIEEAPSCGDELVGKGIPLR